MEDESLTAGESADPEVAASVREILTEHPELGTRLAPITVQQGPGEVFVALEVRLPPRRAGDEIARVINEFEEAMRERRPEVRGAFIEPDL